MPIFEYTCQSCGEEFEQLIRGDEKAACPSCGKKRLSKRWSVPAAHGAAVEPSCPAGQCGMMPPGGCPGGQCGLG
jgi:putative FmdB family regulatory protein